MGSVQGSDVFGVSVAAATSSLCRRAVVHELASIGLPVAIADGGPVGGGAGLDRLVLVDQVVGDVHA